MKSKNLMRVLIILIVIAICLVGFLGIYQKDKNTITNIVADYNFGMNLRGYRLVSLEVDTSTKEIIYDAEGKETTQGKNEDGSLKEGHTKEDKKVNPDEVLTYNNYILAKEILEQRLQRLGATQYNIKQNNETGKIIIELPEEARTDEIIDYLQYKGSFTIIDHDTKEVLLSSNEVKDAMAMYSNTQTGSTTVYLNIEFNKEGKKKLEEITKTYVKQETTTQEGETPTQTEKKVDINFEGTTLLSTGFDETIANGQLQLSMGASTEATKINEYLEQASAIGTIIASGEGKIEYNLAENMYMGATFTKEQVKTIAYVTIAVIVIGLLYWIMRYKVKGVMSAIAYVGTIGLVALLLRYVNVVLSLETIVAFYALLIANFSFQEFILRQMKQEKISVSEAMKNAVKAKLNIIIIFSIIAIVFTFMGWLPIFSIGMVMFWGMLAMLACHYFFTKNLLQEND